MCISPFFFIYHLAFTNVCLTSMSIHKGSPMFHFLLAYQPNPHQNALSSSPTLHFPLSIGSCPNPPYYTQPDAPWQFANPASTDHDPARGLLRPFSLPPPWWGSQEENSSLKCRQHHCVLRNYHPVPA